MKRINEDKRSRLKIGLKSPFMLKVWKSLGITALAFLLSMLLVSPLSLSVMSMFSSPEKEDFTVSDFYAQIADKRPVRTLDPDIVIVDINRAGRAEIAEFLEILQFCAPKAVGVDVLFGEPGDSAVDTRLINSIRDLGSTVVMPVMMAQDDGGLFVIAERSFFDQGLPSADGAVNFTSSRRGAAIREFVTRFPVSETDSIDSFAVAIARIAYPDKATALSARGSSEEYIDYPSREYKIIDINSASDRIEELTDKIILVGALNDADDLHATPVTSRMAGVIVHASALSTILGERYYQALTDWQEWLPALVLCFIVVLMSLTLTGNIKGLLIRLVQVLLVYLAVTIGYGLFVDKRIILNASYTLLMLGFGFFAVDLWGGAAGIISWAHKKYKKWKNS